MGGKFAVIGMSGLFPKAKNVNELWCNIVEKVDCIDNIPELRRKDFDMFYAIKGIKSYTYYEQGYLNEIDKFDHLFFDISKKEADLMDPRQKLFLQTSWQALEDSGYFTGEEKTKNIGVYLGCNGDRPYYELIKKINPSVLGIAFAENSVAISASRLSNIYDFTGPCIVVDTECSSSLVAVHLACQGILSGDCDMAIAGGVDINFDPIKEAVQLGIESSDNRTRAFDNAATGTGNGEGVAAVVIKSLEKALDDKDYIYAVITSSATNNDGYTKGLTTPNAKTQTEVLTKAWEKGGINPEQIQYIEAHGTGTKIGDPIEIRGLQNAFRRFTSKADFCAISSLKSNIGHLNHASGIAGLIKACLSIDKKVIPPTIHYQNPNSEIDLTNSPVYINTTAKDWHNDNNQRYCGVSSFGISGTNCHVLLEQSPHSSVGTIKDNSYYILTLSAKSIQSLKSLLEEYSLLFGSEKNIDIKRLCYTSNVRRCHFDYRAAVILKNGSDVSNIFENFKDITEDYGNKENIYWGHKTSKTVQDLILDESILKNMSDLEKNIENLPQICKLYIKGYDIPWSSYYNDTNLIPMPLPLYSFDKIRCFLDFESVYEKIATESNKNTSSFESSVKNTISSSELQLTGKNSDYSEVEIKLAEIINKIININSIDVNSDLYELGINSITFSKIVIQIEEAFDIAFDDDFLDFDAFTNLQNLGEYIEQKING